ncbi:MAG TPA: hypothetical protein VK501_17990 [Baekduia sp.]|uniref:hypothetical protein n=1 Tax=Baekduia sp. TaxID=2600305 RepID=UPI002B9D68DB|nr:hypothetical protein [Baekduia sp.]HMJ35800.1 hypothetical protein [Baekduia sp.]
MAHPVRRLPLAGLVPLLVLSLAPAGAEAAKKQATKKSCPPGLLPVLKGKGKQAKVVRDRTGRLKCVVPARPSAKALPRPAAPTSTAQLGVVADELESVLTVQPDALKAVERKVGAKRAGKMLSIALDSWRRRAVAASVIRRPRAHAAETRTETYTPVAGAEVKFAGEFTQVDDGSTAGYRGKASVAGEFTRDGLQGLADKADVKLPPGIDKGAFKLELEFADLPRVCPDANGKVKGTLKAGGRITLAVGGASVTLAANIDVSYSLQVGEDARWKTIEDVDVKTELSIGGTGRSTETWRGRRVGSGFGPEGILDSSDGGAAFVRDWGHIDPDQGGVFGPRGGVNFATGKGTLLDIHSIDNFKKMMATNYATQLITLAAVEYVRKVAADRVQKVWYDQEKCLTLDGAAAKDRLRAGGTTTVTAKNAKAANGAPVSTNLTATGVASLTPGSAQMPASASKDFTLTAPPTNPAKSSWKVVALSRAGKKTVSGDLGEALGPYTVTLDDRETGRFATHDATGHLTGTLTTAAVEGSNPQQWTASAPVTWTDVTATPKLDCSYVDPQYGGAWTATITAVGDDRIQVELDFTAQTLVLWTVVCEKASVPGQAGTSPLGMAPRTFELPAGGGTQTLGGSVESGGDGFFTNGTLTVTPTTA